MDKTEGVVWGETVEPKIVARNMFLAINLPNHAIPRQNRQSQLNILTGLDWIAYETVKSIVYEAVNLAEYLKDMTTWHPWNMVISLMRLYSSKTIQEKGKKENLARSDCHPKRGAVILLKNTQNIRIPPSPPTPGAVSQYPH